MIASGNSRKDSQKLKYEGADANCYTYMEKGYQTPYEKKRTASGKIYSGKQSETGKGRWTEQERANGIFK